MTFGCNYETVLSVEDVLDMLPDGEDAEWFALMLRYTGLRVVVTESGSRLSKNWYMYADLIAPDGSFTCPMGGYIPAFIGYDVEECVRRLVRKCYEFDGESFWVTFPNQGSRRFECPRSMSELRMKLELSGKV